MKALFLTNEYPPHIYGGAGIHVDYLTRELAKRIDVEVRCFGHRISASGASSAAVSDRGRPARVGRPVVKGFDFDPKKYRACDPGLKSALTAFENDLAFNAAPIDADLVHCHTWYTHFGGLLARTGYDIPLVITTHSLEPLRPWKREQLGRGYALSTWIEKTALERADGVIAVSEGMKEDILRLFNVSERKIHVIHNGVDIVEFRPAASRASLKNLGIDPDVPYVLFFGRITRQKGIIHLLDALPHLDPDIQVVLCAGRPDTREIAREMEWRVRAAQKTRKNIVWMTRWLDNKTKAAVYSGASVFCCPSIYEPFGIINLEAMACGVPVVGTNVGGIKEIVQHEETGLLVKCEQDKPEKFARDLASGINRLMREESLRKAMGRASRRRVEQYFSWKIVAQKTLAFYRTLL